MNESSMHSHDSDGVELGLRERKKQLTRRNIADAAFALTAERGLDDVTIDQIAERAFVSPRTVSNYFPSKEAAIVAADEIAPAALLHGLDERPAEENPLESLRIVLTAALRGMTAAEADTLKTRERLVDENAALQPHRAAQYDELEDAIRAVVAARSGLDAATDALPRLIAGAATAAVKTAIRVWVNTDGSGEELADITDEAFRELESGLASHS